MGYGSLKVFTPLSDGENDARLPQEGVKFTDLLAAAVEAGTAEAEVVATASSRREERRRQEEENGGTIFEAVLE